MSLPADVERQLRVASLTAHNRRAAGRVAPAFKCAIFGNDWDAFIEKWTPVIYDFVGSALGPYGTQPAAMILSLEDGAHAAGATASFNMQSGQVRLSTSVSGKPGQTLEKLTHEFIHGSLSQFPDGDPFYEEGFVDYSTWVLAHAPIWAEHRADMIAAAEFNVANRRERAMKDISDWDRKRWAGGFYASAAFGPYIIARLQRRKLEGNFTW